MKTLFLRTASMMSARQLVLFKLSLMAGALSLSPLTDLAPVRDWMCVADAVDAETGAGYADYSSGGAGAADVTGAQGIGVAQAHSGTSRGTVRNGGVIYLSGAEAAGVAGVLVRADGQGNSVQGAEAHFEVGGDGSLLLASEDGGKAFNGYTGDGSGGQGARSGAAAGPGGVSGGSSGSGSGSGSNGDATSGTAGRGTTAGGGATGSVGTVGSGGTGIVNNNSGTPSNGTPSKGSTPATPPAPANPGAGTGNASAGTPASPGGSGSPAAGSGSGTPGAGNGNSPGTPVSAPGNVAGTPGTPATGGATTPPAGGNGNNAGNGNGNGNGNGGTPPATAPSGGNQVAGAPPPPGAFDDVPVAPARPAGSAPSSDVPEPASIALVMIGLASVLIARRRKA